MNAKKLEVYTKTIENRTLLRIWMDNLKNCTDSETILDGILEDMEKYPLKTEQVFDGVADETSTYFIKQLIERAVIKVDTEKNLELSNYAHMFVFHAVYDKLYSRYENETNGWYDAVRTEMEMIRSGEYLR